MNKYRFTLWKTFLLSSISGASWPLAAEQIDLKNHWYDTPAKSVLFSQKPMAFNTETCRLRMTSENIFNTRDFVDNRLKQAKALSESFFSDYTQFWQYDGRYYQLTAVWDHDLPASYRIEFYRSVDKQMRHSIEQLSIADVDMQQADALTVEYAFSDTVAAYKEKGALMGANIKVGLLHDSKQHAYEVTLLNGNPVIIAGHQVQCRADDKLQQLSCRCDSQFNHAH